MRFALALQRTDCPITPVKRADFIHFFREAQKNLHFFRGIFQAQTAGNREECQLKRWLSCRPENPEAREKEQPGRKEQKNLHFFRGIFQAQTAGNREECQLKRWLSCRPENPEAREKEQPGRKDDYRYLLCLKDGQEKSIRLFYFDTGRLTWKPAFLAVISCHKRVIIKI